MHTTKELGIRQTQKTRFSGIQILRVLNSVLFGNKKGGGTSAKGESIEAPKAPRGGVWGWGVPLSTRGEVWGWGCPRIFFSFFLSSKLLIFLHFECYFISSSTTDGLLWDDLSGSIAQGNRKNPQDPNGRSCFLTCCL